jgi:hypothetical protein
MNELPAYAATITNTVDCIIDLTVFGSFEFVFSSSSSAIYNADKRV